MKSVVFMLLGILALSGCKDAAISAHNQERSEFVGVWRADVRNRSVLGEKQLKHFVARIEENGPSFLVRFSTEPRAQYGNIEGVYPATYSDGILQTGNERIGSIAYSSSDNAIYVLGWRWDRTSEEKEATRMAQSRAKAEAERMEELAAQQAKRDEAERFEANRQRRHMIRSHVVNCLYRQTSCEEMKNDRAKWPDEVKEFEDFAKSV